MLGRMCPTLPYVVDHQEIPLLNGYSHQGFPTVCGPDCAKSHLDVMIERGPHKSARRKKAIKQPQDKTVDKIKHKYAQVVRWGDINNNIPLKLKISLVTMIPHNSKAFRFILDLSFMLHHNGIKFLLVNNNTSKKARTESMVLLGQVLRRLIEYIWRFTKKVSKLLCSQS